MNRNIKKHIAFNTHLILCFIFFILFLGFSIESQLGNEIGSSVLFAIFALLPVFVFAISPLYCVFTDEYVEIIYNFGQRELIRWNSIRSIYLSGSWFLRRGDGFPHYVIAYPRKEKRFFFIVGEVPKTLRTTKFLKRYWKKEVK